ncbi:unnamed protein product, partial [Acanthoscelides obtectus]
IYYLFSLAQIKRTTGNIIEGNTGSLVIVYTGKKNPPQYLSTAKFSDTTEGKPLLGVGEHTLSDFIYAVIRQRKFHSSICCLLFSIGFMNEILI